MRREKRKKGKDVQWKVVSPEKTEKGEEESKKGGAWKGRRREEKGKRKVAVVRELRSECSADRRGGGSLCRNLVRRAKPEDLGALFRLSWTSLEESYEERRSHASRGLLCAR